MSFLESCTHSRIELRPREMFGPKSIDLTSQALTMAPPASKMMLDQMDQMDQVDLKLRQAG